MEILSWWQKPAEIAALNALCALDGDPGVRCNSTTPADTHDDSLDSVLSRRLLLGPLPATFDASIGVDLLRWAAVEPAPPSDIPGTSRIENLRFSLQDTEIFDNLPPELTQGLRFGAGAPSGHDQETRFAVPLNVHRLNVLYYNRARFESFKTEHGGDDYLRFSKLCPHQWSSRDDPLRELKIAIDLSDKFSLAMFAFENVLVATDPDLYEKLFLGTMGEADWEGVRSALVCVQNLAHHFFLPAAKNLDWAQRVQQVVNHDADFTVTGDWASGELRYVNHTSEVNAVPFPGTEKVFVFTSDTLPVPIGAPDRDTALRFLRTAASREGQQAFSALKGSIPARSDVELARTGVAGFDDWRSSARAAWMDPDTRKLMATSGLVPPYFPAAELRDLLSNVVKAGLDNAEAESRVDIEKLIEQLQRSQFYFQKWQKRLAGSADMPVAL